MIEINGAALGIGCFIVVGSFVMGKCHGKNDGGGVLFGAVFTLFGMAMLAFLGVGS